MEQQNTLRQAEVKEISEEQTVGRKGFKRKFLRLFWGNGRHISLQVHLRNYSLLDRIKAGDMVNVTYSISPFKDTDGINAVVKKIELIKL